MNGMDRRDFIKTVAIGGAVLGLGRTVVQPAMAAEKSGRYDLGQCKSVKITCVSELGWFDSGKLIGQIKAAGGPDTNQWVIPWDPANAAGSCSLVEIEALDGTRRKFLLDTGWDTAYMEKCFQREGIDKMLQSGEIEFLFISHEHLDHLWGLEAVLKYNPDIKILIPSTFYSEGMHFIRGAEFMTPHARNGIPHTGELVQVEPGTISRLYDGCAVAAFDLPILLNVRGESSLYFNVKDKGIVCVAGCCHQSILTLSDFAKERIVGGEKMHGVYGGLHIAPFGPMNPDREHIVKGMAQYGFDRIACNHCTGLVAVQRMIDLGYPVVKGSGRNGSQSDLYVGNGDAVVFG